MSYQVSALSSKRFVSQRDLQAEVRWTTKQQGAFLVMALGQPAVVHLYCRIRVVVRQHRKRLLKRARRTHQYANRSPHHL